MVLTNTARFSKITLEFSFSGTPRQINWIEDPSEQIGIINLETYPAAGTDELTNLEVLQELYAAGFNDADGVAVEVYLDQPSFIKGITDIDELENNGIANPLIADYQDRVLIPSKVDGAFMQGGTEFETDSVSGRRDIKIQGGIVPTRRRPPLQMIYDLHDWVVIPDHNSDTRCYLRYYAAKNRQLNVATCGTHAAVRAMVKYLYDSRSGGDLGSTGPYSLTGLTSALDGTIYTIDQNNNDDYIFQVTDVTLSLAANYLTLRLDAETTSDDLSITALYDTLVISEPAFNIVVNSAEEHPPTSAKDAPTHAYRYHFDDEVSFLRVRDGHPIFKGETAGGHHYELPFGYGRVIEFEDLLEHQGARVLPGDYAIGTIHYDDTHTSNGELRLISPQGLLPIYGTEWAFAVHNKNETYDLRIIDPQGNNVATLLPGEILHLRASRERTGADEYVDDVPFIRSIRFSGGAGNMGDTNVLHLDGTREIHQVAFPSNPTYHNDEAFDFVGPDAWINANNWSSQTGWHTDEAIKILKDGSLRWSMQVSARNNGAGILPSGHQFRLYRQRGTAVPEALRTQTVGQVGGNKSVTWFNNWEGDVEVDDIFFPVIVYLDADTTLDLTKLQLQEVASEMYLTQTIRL